MGVQNLDIFLILIIFSTGMVKCLSNLRCNVDSFGNFPAQKLVKRNMYFFEEPKAIGTCMHHF